MSIIDEMQSLKIDADIPSGLGSILDTLVGCAEEIYSSLVSDTNLSNSSFTKNTSGDTVIEADVLANKISIEGLSKNPNVYSIVSEEVEEPVLTEGSGYSISIDPLDGSKALELGVPSGNIFCIFAEARKISGFSGSEAIVSGFFIFGLTLELFICLDGKVYLLSRSGILEINKLGNRESFICVNLSNFPNWSSGWQSFFNDTLLIDKMEDHSNTRWFGSLVTHAKTLILTGGLFAYPPDQRVGFEKGHLRLIYEAIPIALIIEALGGKATDGTKRILDKTPTSAHEKIPLVIGEKRIVLKLANYLTAAPNIVGES